MRLIDADALKTELEKLRDGWNYYGGEYESAMYQAYDISVDTVDEQPTVQPQRKMGRWIGCKCSECNYEVMKWNKNNFCPNCGAEMSGGGEDD